MSDDNNAPLEFSALDLMPDWAQDKGETKPATQKFKNRDDDRNRDTRGNRGGGKFERRGGPRDNNRRQGGGGGGGFRNDRDRRGGGGGGRGGNQFRGDRRDGGRGNHRDQDENFEIKGLKLTFEPTPEAAKALSKHIQESVKAYPVADLAKMIANSRERYQIKIKADKNGPKIYCGKEDGSAWLSRDEAVSNFLRSKKQISKYYLIEEVDLGAPKGNFSTIAVCGFSGEILGPPNHHEYQKNIVRIHREKFSNMSLERYKQRIQMESGEEVLAKWQEKVSKAFHYRLKSDQVVEEPPVVEETPEAPVEEPANESTEGVEAIPATDEAAPAEAETTSEESAGVDETPTEPETSVEDTAEAAEESSEAEEAPVAKEAEAAKPDGIVLKTPEELERHFRQNYADEEIVESTEAILSGNISGKKLSQDLLTLLKFEGKKLRRGFPFEMFQAVCSCLEKEGLKFFKRGKKALHVSMVRPQPISNALSLTDRIQKIIKLVTDNPKIQTADVLEQLCEGFKREGDEKAEAPKEGEPEPKQDLSEEAKAVLADIRWLAMEGYLVEFPDTHLELGKVPRPEGEAPANQPKKKGAAKKKQQRRKPTLPGGICTFTIADLAKPAPADDPKPEVSSVEQ